MSAEGSFRALPAPPPKDAFKHGNKSQRRAHLACCQYTPQSLPPCCKDLIFVSAKREATPSLLHPHHRGADHLFWAHGCSSGLLLRELRGSLLLLLCRSLRLRDLLAS